jgi:hypothetical protein
MTQSDFAPELEYVAGYVSPLTDVEHAQIGRIAILWGQIENYCDELLEDVSGLKWDELKTLGVTDKMIAAKADFLSKASIRIADVERQETLKSFCALIKETKQDRNHVFHGMWGWRGDKRSKTVVPAARKESNIKAPFPAKRLPELEKKLCRCSRLGSNLVNKLWGGPANIRTTRYIHHDADVAEDWLKEWSARNKCNVVGKEGELLRMKALLPTR